MRKSTGLMAALLLLLCCCASPASAQETTSIIELKQGSVGISQFGFPNMSYQFSGREAVVQGYVPSGDGFANPSCQPCRGGETVRIMANFASEKPGSLTYNGVGRDLYIRTSLTFDGGLVTLPHRYTRLPIKITLPATVSGSLTGFNRNPFVSDPGPAVFTTPVSLHGTVTLTLIFRGTYFGGKPIYSMRSMTYDFPPPSENQ